MSSKTDKIFGSYFLTVSYVRNEGISSSGTDFSGSGCFAFHVFHMQFRRFPLAITVPSKNDDRCMRSGGRSESILLFFLLPVFLPLVMLLVTPVSLASVTAICASGAAMSPTALR